MTRRPFDLRRLGLRVVLSTLALAVIGGPALAAQTPDDWITTRIKIGLWTSAQLPSTAVHVDTADGKVTLYGKVRTDEQRQTSESVAHAIPGVKSIRNLLHVVPEASEKAVEVADDKIKEKVAKALKDDKVLAASSITVKSVDKGAVLLAGKAASLSDYLLALDVVNDVPGVRRIDSEVNAPDQIPDFVRHAAGGARNSAADDWITTATKMRLMADSSVPALEVSVDTRRGVVTLFGIVPSALARSAAEADTRKVGGVLGVANELEVVARTDKADVDQKDDAIRDGLAATYKADDSFKHVDIRVKNGVVRLTGHVVTSDDRLHAGMAARAARGVRSVDNDLKLKTS